MTKKIRNSNFEFLRLLSMFLIVFGHLAMFTPWQQPMKLWSETYTNSMWVGAKFGVNLFVLISAYFLSTSSRVHWKSLEKLWLSTYFYNWLCIGGLALSGITITGTIMFNGFFPIFRGAYWFVTAYFVMILLTPFLNMVIRNCDKKSYIYLLAVLFIFLSIAPTFFAQQISNIGNGCDTAWLLFIYLCGGYIRKYQTDIKKIRFPAWWLLFIASFLVIIAWIFMSELIKIDPKTNTFAYLFVNKNIPSVINPLGAINPLSDGTSPFELLMSIAIFIIALKMKPTHSKTINLFAGSTFAVYLIATSQFGLNYACNILGKLNLIENRLKLIPISIGVAFAVFAFCIILDQMVKLILFIFKYNYSKIFHRNNL